MRKISVLDTTLRDGEQSPGCSMTLAEKLRVAKSLERLGVDTIEAGFPISSPDDFAAVSKIAATIRNCTVAALCRTTNEDIECGWDAIGQAVSPRLHLFLATSDIHLEYKLKINREQVLALTHESVRKARALCPEVMFSAEDATRTDREFLLEVFQTAVNAGARIVNIPDTVGYATPVETAELVRFIRENLPDNVSLGVHCHNDLGMATANTLSAIQAGADHFDGAIGGIGERAGNVAIEEVAMALKTRGDYYDCDTGIDTRRLYEAAQILFAVIGQNIPHNKPIVGENAFAHEAGIHQHGVLANPLTYEIMKPQDVGLSANQLVLGKHSGKAAIRDRLRSLGLELEDRMVEQLFREFKILADRKKLINDNDIRKLALNLTKQGA